MSSIKLKHSGGNSVSLNPPTSAPTSSEVAFKLPTSDGTAGQVLQTDGSGNLSWVTLPTAGISMVDTWDLSSVISMGNDTETTITTQWSRANGFNGTIGSAMTVDSNGIFTFPSTGIYRVLFHLSLYNNSGNAGRYAFARIKATENNSGYATRSQAGSNSIGNSGYVYQTLRAEYIFDVVDTSTHKIYFTAVHDQPATINGDASADSNLHTYVMFTRLGDT